MSSRADLSSLMSVLLFCAPFFIAFEIWQLVLSERYLGIAQIEKDADPRTLGLSEITAFLWVTGIFVSVAWCVLMLTQANGRSQALCMLVVTILGYSVRRTCGLKWILVTLTFEGAIRVGMLFSLLFQIWRHV